MAYRAVHALALAVHRKCHTSKRPPDVILHVHSSFTRPSALAVMEGTRLILVYMHLWQSQIEIVCILFRCNVFQAHH